MTLIGRPNHVFLDCLYCKYDSDLVQSHIMSFIRDPQMIYLSFILAHRKSKTELQALTAHALNDPLAHLFIGWSV